MGPTRFQNYHPVEQHDNEEVVEKTPYRETTSREATFPPPTRQGPRHVCLAILLFVSLPYILFLHVLPRALNHSRSYQSRRSPLSDQQPTTIESRVDKILRETPLIDGHNDLAIFIRFLYNNHIYDPSFEIPFTQGGLPYHVDLPRLRAGKSGGAFWSVFVPCPANETDWSDANYAGSVQFTLDQIDLMHRLARRHPGNFSTPFLTGEGALEVFHQGKLISPLGVEGLHQIGNSVANLRHFYTMGVRYATLTHNCGNIYADAALWENPLRVPKPVHKGLSKEGRKLIAEMNRLGMMVDLSHTSPDTQIEVLGGIKEDTPDKTAWNGSLAPVIFSHSSAYSICPHPRNVKDEVLQLVKEKNSVVMVNFSPDFISCIDVGSENGIPEFYPQNSTLAQVAKHIMHIGDLIGYDHVGIGSDFDGIGSTPDGLEDVSKFPDLVAELLKNGVSDEDVSKVVGGNVLRVWRKADQWADYLQTQALPLEDDLDKLMG